MTTKRLEAIGACRDAITWVRESDLTLEDAWLACPRGDWLLWYAAKAGADRRSIVRCACEIVRIALPLVPSGEVPSPLAACRRPMRRGAASFERRPTCHGRRWTRRDGRTP